MVPPPAEHLEDLVVAAVLGNDVLAGLAAKPVQEAVEVRVVERPGDGVGGEAQEAQHVAGHLEIAEMGGDDQRRPIAQQQPHQLGRRLQPDELAPVGLVDLSRRVGHLQHQQEQVFPHLPGQPPPLGRRRLGKGVAQVLVDHLRRGPGARRRTATPRRRPGSCPSRSASPERCRSRMRTTT